MSSLSPDSFFAADCGSKSHLASTDETAVYADCTWVTVALCEVRAVVSLHQHTASYSEYRHSCLSYLSVFNADCQKPFLPQQSTPRTNKDWHSTELSSLPIGRDLPAATACDVTKGWHCMCVARADMRSRSERPVMLEVSECRWNEESLELARARCRSELNTEFRSAKVDDLAFADNQFTRDR